MLKHLTSDISSESGEADDSLLGAGGGGSGLGSELGGTWRA